jgi:hypothetical protein
MRSPDVVLRSGDRLPGLARTVSIDGAPVVLTGYTAKFRAQDMATQAFVIDAAAQVDGDQLANPGVVSYSFTAQDAAVAPGIYAGWFEVTTGSTVMSAPNDGFLVVQVVADGGAVWSYTGSPSTRPLDAVRFLSGDTDPADQKVLDAEITFLLSENGGDTYLAAASVADQLAAISNSQSLQSKSVGDLSLTYSHSASAKQYSELADRLRARASKMSMGASGITGGGAGRDPIFTVGLFDTGGDLPLTVNLYGQQ